LVNFSFARSESSPAVPSWATGKTRNDIIKLLLRDQFLPVEGLLSQMFLFCVGQGRFRLLQYGRRLPDGKPVIGLLDIGNDLTGGYGRSFVDVDRPEDSVQFGTDIDNFVRIEVPIDSRAATDDSPPSDPDVDGPSCDLLFCFWHPTLAKSAAHKNEQR
jgi:hypothetical protein